MSIYFVECGTWTCFVVSAPPFSLGWNDWSNPSLVLESPSRRLMIPNRVFNQIFLFPYWYHWSYRFHRSFKLISLFCCPKMTFPLLLWFYWCCCCCCCFCNSRTILQIQTVARYYFYDWIDIRRIPFCFKNQNKSGVC